MDCIKCKAALRAVMARPKPRALLDAFDQSGVKVSTSGLAPADHQGPNSGLTIMCVNCSDEGVLEKARAFMQAPPLSVVLCANRLRDRDEMEEALVHELVHAYDHGLDGRDISKCDELAYSEVRAAREAECHYRSHLCSWFQKNCVKTTATRSTKVLFPEEASECVGRVFARAYTDLRPMSGSVASSARKAAPEGPAAADAKPVVMLARGATGCGRAERSSSVQG